MEKSRLFAYTRYEQKNNSGHAKVANVLTYISTFATLLRPVKKLNCLDELSKLNFLNEIG